VPLLGEILHNAIWWGVFFHLYILQHRQWMIGTVPSLPQHYTQLWPLPTLCLLSKGYHGFFPYGFLTVKLRYMTLSYVTNYAKGKSVCVYSVTVQVP
jgi:hypothetical protein